MTPVDKNQLLELIVEKLEDQRRLLVAAAQEAKDYSTAEESKAENKYDTRGLEASYLASGQSQRASKLQEQIYLLKNVRLKDFAIDQPIGIGALIELSVNDKLKRLLFFLPVGGVEVSIGLEKIQSITLESPIGREVHNQATGFEFQINGNDYVILSVL